MVVFYITMDLKVHLNNKEVATCVLVSDSLGFINRHEISRSLYHMRKNTYKTVVLICCSSIPCQSSSISPSNYTNVIQFISNLLSNQI